MSKEVFRDIWIKAGKYWGVDDIMEEEACNQHQKQIERYSESYRKRKLSLLGHVIRADNTDPMKQVAMENGTITGKQFAKEG